MRDRTIRKARDLMEVKKKRDGSLKVLLKDEDIRPVLFEYLESGTPVIRFFEELVLGRSRADAVMISSSTETPSGYAITGFEIKSDKDQLRRLERQSRNYSHYCDFNYLVTGEKYAGVAEEEIPETWGIYLVRAEAKVSEKTVKSEKTEKSEKIEKSVESEKIEKSVKSERSEKSDEPELQFFVEQIRPAKPTPRLRLTTQMKLLWRTELTSIIRAYKLGGVSGKNKMRLSGMIIEKLGKDEAHRQMCLQLLDRDYTIFDKPEPKEKKDTETTGAEKKSTEKKSTEKKSAEKKSTEKKSTETKSTETKSAEKKSSVKKRVKKKSTEPKATEKKSPDKKGTDKKTLKEESPEKGSSKKGRSKKKSSDITPTIIIAQ